MFVDNGSDGFDRRDARVATERSGRCRWGSIQEWIADVSLIFRDLLVSLVQEVTEAGLWLLLRLAIGTVRVVGAIIIL